MPMRMRVRPGFAFASRGSDVDFSLFFFVEKKGLAAAKTLAREQNWPGRRARTWTHATTIAGCLPAAFEEHAAQSGRA